MIGAVTWAFVSAPDGVHSLERARDGTSKKERRVVLLFGKDAESRDGDRQITGALPKMIEKAASAEHKRGFETRLREAEEHLVRLEQILRMHGAGSKVATWPAIDVILKAANSMAGNVADSRVLDAALIFKAPSARARKFSAILHDIEVGQLSTGGMQIGW